MAPGVIGHWWTVNRVWGGVRRHQWVSLFLHQQHSWRAERLGAGVPAFVLRPWQGGCGCCGCCGQLSWIPAICLPLISLAPDDASDPFPASTLCSEATLVSWFCWRSLTCASVCINCSGVWIFFFFLGYSSQHERVPAAFASCASPASLALSNGRFCLFLVGNKSL